MIFTNPKLSDYTCPLAQYRNISLKGKVLTLFKYKAPIFSWKFE